MRIFISGGCKNGKSTYAQRLAKQQSTPLYYVATMKATDNEDTQRIIRHQNERDGWGFTTVEQPINIEGILTTCDPNGSFLLDSTTALLANEMFSPTGEVDDNAWERIASGLTQVLASVSNIVIVSDYIYSDAFLYDEFTENYRKSLALIDRLAAKQCDVVLEAAFTQIITHKGGGLLNALD
ncbi:MAG: bifunctional adenosylcobinamide kinase/adenosylcobinamide-phosphate guanylyltransferase [Defluviitaleaceae bacterium]|nr:bifunctional adenosylcobinamide kinase/adenosylcobinamide-phosphate guanylyltransferase [Defluviitaleaceae bacterium]